jgi:hypothetical protein
MLQLPIVSDKRIRIAFESQIAFEVVLSYVCWYYMLSGSATACEVNCSLSFIAAISSKSYNPTRCKQEPKVFDG